MSQGHGDVVGTSWGRGDMVENMDLELLNVLVAPAHHHVSNQGHCGWACGPWGHHGDMGTCWGRGGDHGPGAPQCLGGPCPPPCE